MFREQIVSRVRAILLSNREAKFYNEHIRLDEMKGEAKQRILDSAGVFFGAISEHDGFKIGIKPAKPAEGRMRPVRESVAEGTYQYYDADN